MYQFINVIGQYTWSFERQINQHNCYIRTMFYIAIHITAMMIHIVQLP